jgi:tripartite-type tricarboxylate transporter receptor subunit TctC
MATKGDAMQACVKRLIAVASVWLMLCAAVATAQDYPARTVKIIIPLGAGGGGDVFARAIADQLQKTWGQPFVVENRPGGAQNIGARACAESPPDGYTICVLSTEPMVYNQFQYKNPGYDPAKDFVPIRHLFFNSLALVANPSLNVKTIPDLIALAKSKPGTLSYGSFSFPFVQFMDKLNKAEGIDIVRVPFKSGGEATTAVLSGSTPVGILALSNMVPLLQSGRITAIVIMGKKRSPLLPEVPTLAEARPRDDYPPPWFGLFAPAGTPQPIVAKLASEVGRILDDPAFRGRMYTQRGVEPSELQLEEFASFIRHDRAIAERIFLESGLKPM